MGAPEFSDVPDQYGEEATGVGSLGGRGADGKGLLGVWYTADGGILVPVPGTNVVVHRQILAVGGTQLPEGARKIGTAGEYLGREGGQIIERRRGSVWWWCKWCSFLGPRCVF